MVVVVLVVVELARIGERQAMSQLSLGQWRTIDAHCLLVLAFEVARARSKRVSSS